MMKVTDGKTVGRGYRGDRKVKQALVAQGVNPEKNTPIERQISLSKTSLVTVAGQSGPYSVMRAP